jgi:catechol 2,3-dioxygenase-like lactoylglutathione lyase family enzyme
MSYESRTGAVLFASSLDRVATFYSVVLGLDEVSRDADHILLESPGFQLVVHRIPRPTVGGSEALQRPIRRATAAFKPVFFVPSITGLREIAATHGGSLEPADREWSFKGVQVCDALDPEGNVIQLRERGR